MKEARWISKELDHLNKYMVDLQTDMRYGDEKAAKVNWGFAMNIVQGMIKREKQFLRSSDKMGGVLKFIYKKIKPLLREVAKEGVKSYMSEKRRNDE